MREVGYRNFNHGSAFSDADGALRYLRGKDQRLIREDDPGFFSFPADEEDNVSLLSSSHQIFPHKRKEAH